MSQHIVYKCNNDGKEIGAKTHITLTLMLSTGTGIAVPGKNKWEWATKRFNENFLHFHNGKCAGEWFDKQIKIATQEKKK